MLYACKGAAMLSLSLPLSLSLSLSFSASLSFSLSFSPSLNFSLSFSPSLSLSLYLTSKESVCGRALCLQGCAHPLYRSEREREREKEGGRERERCKICPEWLFFLKEWWVPWHLLVI
jgi:hypothetical protein